MVRFNWFDVAGDSAAVVVGVLGAVVVAWGKHGREVVDGVGGRLDISHAFPTNRDSN